METRVASNVPRQIFAVTTTSRALPHTCAPTILSSGGLINIGSDQIITLTQHAGFQPYCSGTPVPQPVDPTQPGIDLKDVFGSLEPFYASTGPQVYAIAVTTAVSYMLVIMLFITPRTYFVGGVGGGGGFLGSRGVSGGSYGNNPVIGVGSRPWLQKAATFAVAVSLTIVTADTFKWAERQYEARYEDPVELANRVMDGLEIRVVRVISETFLWLAQAQTLIRLFPRHKEKLVIKWTAFGLITLELIFSILNFFVDRSGYSQDRHFDNAVPALDYLFALTLNLCYAAFVFYYAMCKRRFAFYHQSMRNMPLVALIALIAVLIPVIFFILDLSKPEFASWGGYVRWVGAAAASVVVWEWVERIEALERDEKKDGILGREIFDGDEMLETNPNSQFTLGHSGRQRSGGGGGGARGGGDGGIGHSVSSGWNDLASRTRNLRRGARKSQRTRRVSNAAAGQRAGGGPFGNPRHQAGGIDTTPNPPPNVVSPVSRTDTTSAASTVYRVHYHPVNEYTPPIRESVLSERSNSLAETQQPQQRQQEQGGNPAPGASPEPLGNTITVDPKPNLSSRLLLNGMSRVIHPFKHPKNSPPLEVVQAISSNPPTSAVVASSNAAESGLLKRFHFKRSQRADLPPEGVIVVPAPSQRRPHSGHEDDQDDGQYDYDDQPAETADELAASNRDLTTNGSNSHASRFDTDSPPDAVLRALHEQSRSQSRAYSRTSTTSPSQGAGNASTVASSSSPAAPTPGPSDNQNLGSNSRSAISWSRNDTPMISEEEGTDYEGPWTRRSSNIAHGYRPPNNVIGPPEQPQPPANTGRSNLQQGDQDE